MRKLLFACLLTGAFQAAFAQSGVKGRVADTLNKKPLDNAVVSLLRKSDSTLYKFTRTNKEGDFSISNLIAGKYLLLVTYPKFVDFADEIELDGSDKNLGSIPLTLQSHLLDEVVIRQNIAIRIKGDTIEYKADSFKVAEGASVKDLLKKLPGMQVDKDGRITAQGEKVNKVLVDGEEFFSDDPAVVIENLRADAVDKVQSFDKKSDQAEFTGVDDGSRSKTLNLVLKEDKKKGYLGKVVLGGGSNERYSEQAMLNYFKGKKKISVYGIASNTGQTGLGWGDRDKFGGGSDFGDAEVEMGAGFIMIMGNNDQDFSDWENQYRDEGIPRTIKAGGHYSDKWNSDKQSVNGNYSIKDMNVNAVGNSLKKFLLPDTSYYSNEDHISKSAQTQHLFTGTYDFKIDSMSSVRLKFNGKVEDKKNYTVTNTETLDEDEVLVNRNGRLNTVNTNNKVFLGSALWRQKFKKKGRTISLSGSYKNGVENSDGYLNSGTEFYNSGILNRTDSVNQYKTAATTTATINSKLVYTEPAGKKGIVEFNYTLNNVKSNSDRKSFDKVAGKYESLNPLFSNKYQLDYLSNSGGVKYQYNGKKLIANIGSNLGMSNQTQRDSVGKEVGQLNFTNLFPTSRITYRFAPQRSLNLNYSGTPQSPTIEQVQPILENTNPLFVTLGNPTLRQSFRHNVSVFFNDYKTLSGRSIWINGSVTPVHDAIVTSQVIDSGITRQRYVNAKGNYDYWFYVSYNIKIKKLDMFLGFNANNNGGSYVNYVNGLKNSTHQATNGVGINIGKYKENKFEFNLSSNFSYNKSQSTTQKVSYWSSSDNANVNIYITKNFQLGTDADLTLRQKTDAFTGNNNFFVWNANASYKVFKKRNGVFKLEMNDILQQRRGYERTFNS
ncbi:MAG: TonB-dependent receptor, partial [Flavisolibacter sp.]